MFGIIVNCTVWGWLAWAVYLGRPSSLPPLS